MAELHQSSPAELKARLEAERRGVPVRALPRRRRHAADVELGERDRVSGVGRRRFQRLPVPGNERSRASTRTSSASAGSGPSSTTGARATARSSTASASTGRRRCATGTSLGSGRTSSVPRPSGRDSLRTADVSSAGRAVDHGRPAARPRRALPAATPTRRSRPPRPTQQIAKELSSAWRPSSRTCARVRAFALGGLPQHHKRAALARAALERGVVSARELRESTSGRGLSCSSPRGACRRSCRSRHLQLALERVVRRAASDWNFLTPLGPD